MTAHSGRRDVRRPLTNEPELLDRIRQEISARLAELRPVVDEHARLDAAMHALGEAPKRPVAPPATFVAPAESSRAEEASGQTAQTRAEGANREAVLRAVRERPGASAAELAAVSKVDRNTLNALLARLVKAGELQTRELPIGRAGYALGDGTSAGPAAADEPAGGVGTADVT